MHRQHRFELEANMTVRSNVLFIRLTPAERRQINALATAEKLPAATLARRRLLFEAEQRGIVALPENANRGATDSKAQRAAIA